ncbi:MAG: hypothetical protein DWQ07_22915 [Chloroflexi bacterium]|nr:MAG: hypothetical protein DWQ07_22915 [Chloroflexota bacterium]MBL1194001.1 hypothetical protein [Chloroflexota bacterium]NOH11295.1 hypothetical protein [Chloroflexota bacterium]
MKKKQLYRYLVITSLGAGLALAAMLAVSLFNAGVTAQDFELFAPPEEYAQAITQAEAPLRAILTIDNIFLTLYAAAFVFLATAVWRKRNRLLVAIGLGAVLITTYLDLHENHELLTFLEMAIAGLPIDEAALHQRMVWSQLKFHSSYFAFFLLAFVLPKDTFLEKLLRWSLWLGYLPIGILVYTYPSSIFSLLRYLFMLSGFFILAWNYYQRWQKE